MLIVTASQMKEIEQAALSYDLTLLRLMENAGSAAAAFIRRSFPLENINCIVFSGRGNNGGDGFVTARKLHEYGANVVVVLVQGKPRTDQAQQMFQSLVAQQIPVFQLEEQRDLVESYTLHADLIVDAIYGIGFHGNLTGQNLIACEMINQAPAVVVSLDCPSGIGCDRGTVAYGSVKAEFTVAFQLKKPLHILPNSKEYCGQIHLVDIGIPPESYAQVESRLSTITAERVWEWIPPRLAESHKGDYGRLLSICGSAPYRGAALLAATGALRTGVGVCVAAAPELVCAPLAGALPEVILQPLPLDPNGQFCFEGARPLLERQLVAATAVLFGCGVGLGESSQAVLELLLRRCRVPLIIDADGLTLLAKHLPLLKQANCPIIITPHPGEMATLAQTTAALVQKDRLSTALDFAETHQVTVVLKGEGSLVALPDGQLHLNHSGNPGLAKAGSGDLLSGMIASFAAQGLEAGSAAAAGIWLHGAAGDRCSHRLSQAGMLPHDLVDDLCQIFHEAGR